ncbi:hypothetical protein LBMAG27_07440 [Bacteroidota bacterium]|nr:hypothetical protein LBMAG27_07440 [Bacteroidota bacterium]
MKNTANETYTGRVIFYNKNKGFGGISHAELGDVFLHQSKMGDIYKVAHKNDLVSFEAIPSTRKHGVFEAINVKFIENENLNIIINAFAQKENMKGKVLTMNAGGLLLDVLGIEVFLPKSEVDVYEFNSYSIFLGKELEFKIIGIDERSIIASRKVVLEEEENAIKKSHQESVGINKVVS